VTGLGKKFIVHLPNSLKGGILIGAGIGAIMTEIEPGGRIAETPYSLLLGGFLCLYIMFSKSFKRIASNNRFFRLISSYCIMPAIIVAIVIGWIIKKYSYPRIEWGVTVQSYTELWNITSFVVGFHSIKILMLAFPTVILAYIIEYGENIVEESFVKRANDARDDEKISFDLGQVLTLA